MNLRLAACAATLLLATGASTASAATMTPTPAKKCFRDGEIVNLGGTGFTPEQPGQHLARGDGARLSRSPRAPWASSWAADRAPGHGAAEAHLHGHGRGQPGDQGFHVAPGQRDRGEGAPGHGHPGQVAAHRRPRLHHGKDALRPHRAQGQVPQRAHRPAEGRLLQGGGPQAPVHQEDEGGHATGSSSTPTAATSPTRRCVSPSPSRSRCSRQRAAALRARPSGGARAGDRPARA